MAGKLLNGELPVYQVPVAGTLEQMADYFVFPGNWKPVTGNWQQLSPLAFFK